MGKPRDSTYFTVSPANPRTPFPRPPSPLRLAPLGAGQYGQAGAGPGHEAGASMGLPKKITLSDDQLRRSYITVIRQNWHILPDEQIVQLLGWSFQEYEYHLKEDDFLWAKLGMLKPHCETLHYEVPSSEAKRRAAEIRRLV